MRMKRAPKELVKEFLSTRVSEKETRVLRGGGVTAAGTEGCRK